ncbi:hypothetical protein CHLRE_10g428350v5 [Chlamydomonas reinhardtii]|uniref:Uncharacterized protein n=1 Tax=Chlamydomonas reinhardtii TaxID=3055 RepID=A0A2K3D9N2_CHLRE|nr:uncharacterized protein CHLRE_10g428350v5 [Chlamydomonas reinhardtii]PNW77242.1 hypothetical protein CHLRE_10g428350v5 [Chlamydomonas reinhardtii]7PKT_D Chain D, mL40 [Chlamydomonas reinhardtii]
MAGFTKATSTKGAAMKRNKGAASGGVDEENARVKAMVAMLQPPAPAEATPLTPAEQAAAQQLQQQRVAEHQAWVKDMTTKFKLQQAALRALPERLRVLAMQPDHTPYPLNRKFLFDSPPAAYRDTPAGKTASGASAAAEASAGAGKGAEAASGGGKQAGGKQGGSRKQQGGR